MLGFDASGRLALGQLPALAASNTVMVATVGAHAVAGRANAFRVSQPSGVRVYAVAGQAARFGAKSPGSASGFAVTSRPVGFRLLGAVSRGGCAVAGGNVRTLHRFAAAAGARSVFGRAGLLGASLVSRVGSCSVIGYEAGYFRDFEAWFPRPFDSDGWTAEAVAGESWTTPARQNEAWTVQAAQSDSWIAAAEQPETWSAE